MGEMAMFGDRSNTYDIDDNFESLEDLAKINSELEKKFSEDGVKLSPKDISLLRTFEHICKYLFRDNDENFIDIFYHDTGENLLKFVRTLGTLTKQILNNFHTDNLQTIKTFIDKMWARSNVDMGITSEEVGILAKISKEYFEKEIKQIFQGDIRNAEKHITRAIIANIIRFLSDKKDSSGNTIYELEDPKAVFDGLNENLQNFITIPNIRKLTP